MKTFILQHCQKDYPGEDYREFIQLAALIVGLDIKVTIRKPAGLHRARWMAKAIYSMKIELLLRGNEAVIKLTASELRSIHRFNRFVVCVYFQSWFTSRIVEDAPVNDVQLIQRLNAYDDQVLRDCGLNMMKRHSWYISQELATLALFSHRLSSDEKTLLITFD